MALGSAPFSVGATASSGLTVGFASNSLTICTVSGTTVTLVAAGTCSLTASQAGNATYAAAAPVTQTFTTNTAIVLTTVSGVACDPASLGASGIGTCTVEISLGTSGGTSITLGSNNAVLTVPRFESQSRREPPPRLSVRQQEPPFQTTRTRPYRNVWQQFTDGDDQPARPAAAIGPVIELRDLPGRKLG